MHATRVIVFGYGPLAIAALDTLAGLAVKPVAVVVPGNRQGAEVEMVRARGAAAAVPVLTQPLRRSIAPFLDAIRSLAPDLILVWSYSMLLPPELTALAPLGAVNLHGGLLPEYRGGHVMNWAIANGERETGVTLAAIDEGIDTGPIIAERRIAIERDDDAASVRDKLRVAGQHLLENWWPVLITNTAPRTPQDESRARYYRMRRADDGRIDWSQTSEAIRNLVRALVAPWPGAFTEINRTRIVLRRVEALSEDDSAVAGTVLRCEQGDIRIAGGRGQIRLLAAEVAGAPVDAAALTRLGVIPGVRL